MITLDIDEVRNPRKAPRLRRISYACYDHELNSPHPYIRMQGKYLEQYGFKIGDTIEVELEWGRITITNTVKAHKMDPYENGSKGT